MAAKKKAVSEPPKSARKTPSVPPVVAEVLTEGTFSVEKFVENFEVLVEAAGGTGRLRQMVANWAIHGKLVSSTGSVDTATALVQSVIKKAVLQDVPSSDVPFQAPPGWTWCFLGNLCVDVHYGFTASARPELRKTRLLRITDIQNDRVEWDSVPGCEIEDEKIAQYALRDGDLLIARTGGTIGKTYLVHNPTVQAVFASYLIRALPVLSSVSPYLKLYAGTSLYWRQLYAGAAGTGQPNVNATTLKALLIPLPPLAEQKRIIARVDQLMALIDELEAKQNRKRELSAKFSKASLEALTNAQNPEEFDVAWKRVVANWETVVDRAERVEEIRSSVIELGVRGQLVASEPGDGVAPDFAEANDEPFPLPSGWRWSHLERLATHVVDCPHATPKYTSSGYPAIRTSDVVPGKMLVAQARFVDEAQYQSQIRRLEPKSGDIFYSREGGRLGIAACVPAGVKVCLSQRMMQLRIRQPINPQFIMWTMNSRFVFSQAAVGTGGSASPHVNIAAIRRFLVPVPPVAQQKRIVDRIEQLLKLSDQLETALQRSQKCASRLTEAVVGELVA
jgi:type I restriction enzyme S subunit